MSEEKLSERLAQIKLSAEDRINLENKIAEITISYNENVEFNREMYMRQDTSERFKNMPVKAQSAAKETYDSISSLKMHPNTIFVDRNKENLEKSDAQLAKYSSPEAIQGAEAGAKLPELSQRLNKLTGTDFEVGKGVVNKIVQDNKDPKEIELPEGCLKKTSWKDKILGKVGIKTKTVKHNEKVSSLFEEIKQTAVEYQSKYPSAPNGYRPPFEKMTDCPDLLKQNRDICTAEVQKTLHDLKFSMAQFQAASQVCQAINSETDKRADGMTGTRLSNLAIEKREQAALAKEIGLKTAAREGSGVAAIQNNTGVDKLAEKAKQTKGMDTAEVYAFRKSQMAR